MHPSTRYYDIRKIINGYSFCFSQFCYCGNTYGIFGTSQFCLVKCAGNNSQICGGDNSVSEWANNVYRTINSIIFYYKFFRYNS